MKKTNNIFIILILFFAIIFRFYRFDNPVADWHSWRQADTSSVSRNFIKYGFDVFHPKFDDLSNVASGLDNPNGYRFVEFPVYNLFQAGLYSTFQVFTLEEWGRLVTIFSSVSTVFLIYLIMKKVTSNLTALLSSFFYAFLPYSIYYGRVILPDTSMVAATIASVYFTMRWLEKENKTNVFFILSVASASTSLLLKPYAVFFLLPVVYLVFRNFGMGTFKNWRVWVFAFFVIAPVVAWRWWMQQYPEGIPANTWLLNGNGIRLRPAFFRWIFYERVFKLISGYFGVIFLALGVINVYENKNKWFFVTFIIASLAYVVVFATGNVQHDYYQILVMPTISIFYGLGASYLINNKYNKSIGIVIFVVITTLSLVLSWNRVKDYFNINNFAIVTAGKAVERVTPVDAKVVAIYNGDTSFLYQTNRRGWASYEKPLDEMRDNLGAGYLALVNPTQADYEFSRKYILLEKGENYLIFSLEEVK